MRRIFLETSEVSKILRSPGRVSNERVHEHKRLRLAWQPAAPLKGRSDEALHDGQQRVVQGFFFFRNSFFLLEIRVFRNFFRNSCVCERYISF